MPPSAPAADSDRVADVAERAADLAADHAAGEQSTPTCRAAMNCPTSSIGVVDAVVIERRLHGLDHVLLGHACKATQPVADAGRRHANLPDLTERSRSSLDR